MATPPLSTVTFLPTSREDRVKELRTKYPGRRVAIVVTGGKDYYILSPTRHQWHAFKDAALDSKRRRVAMENLAVACVIDPAPELVKNWIESTDPALAETLADKIGRLGGYDDEAEMLDFPET
jgi:hypothetical protein